MKHVRHVDRKTSSSNLGAIRVYHADGHRAQLPKCPKCGIEIAYREFTFKGIPKKYFCSSCWYKIYTIWKAQKYIFEDPDSWYWTSKIKEED